MAMAAFAENAEVARERALREGLGAGKATRRDIPTIDLRSQNAEDELWQAATEIGFFQIIGHGIAQEDIDRIFSLSASFFDLPLEVKNRYPLAKAHNAGYEYMAQVRPSTGLPDQKESFQVTARPEAMERRWPAEVPNFEQRCCKFLEQARDVGCRIMGLLEKRCGLEPGILAAAHNLWAEDCQTTLRLLKYPPVDPKKCPTGTFRAGAHTDWCCVTLLFQRLGESGLECAANPRSDMGAGWTPVDPVTGAIAVNIGDMLMRWSDDALLSNLHRVRMPESEEEMKTARFSTAVFLQADRGKVIQGAKAKYEPITAGEYIQMRVRSNFAKDEEPAAKKAKM